MKPEEIEAMFTREGAYAFARWGRPIAPVVFGVEADTLATVKAGLQAVAALAGQELAETDPELGANLMVFFLRDWAELRGVPNLDAMIPGLDATVTRLEAGRATRYRSFRFDAEGAIRAAFVFIRLGEGLETRPADEIALAEAVQALLTWAPGAFAARSPLARHPQTGAALLRPEVAALIRAAYDPVLPASAQDPAHAYRLFARITP